MATKSTSVKVTLKITGFILRLLLNIIFYILVIILIVNVSKAAYEFTYQMYGPVAVDPAPGREIIFKIKKGESTMDIASKLEINHAIVNKYSFYLRTKLQNLVIMPGTYRIYSSMTYKQILDTITDYSASIIQDEPAPDGGGTGSDTQSGTDQNTQTGTDQDKQTDTNQNTQSETGQDTQTGTDTQTDTGTNP
jgi:UPF0755 protein